VPFERSAFVRDLSNWFASAQRDLPWRHPENARDPYRILVSEVMLQQTTVAAVIPYFLKFTQSFPTVRHLAEASEEEVLAHWAGLGYYARARNLQKCAREVVDKHEGIFPADLEQILGLSGVGRYTAGAVASIAFDRRAPIVDANVARVLSRVFLIEGDLKSTANQKQLWDEAGKLVERPEAVPSQFNPAMMELGALICVPKNPRCEFCPVSAHCGAFREGRQAELPFVAPRVELTPVYDVCAFAVRENSRGEAEVFLRRRPDEPRLWWRGMWELPRVTCSPVEGPEEALARLGVELGIVLRPSEKIATLKHGVTRFAITLDCFEAEVSAPESTDGSYGWFSWDAAAALPMPTSMRRLLKQLGHRPARQLSLL
jgi:A/G-specific adenine glycosylase